MIFALACALISRDPGPVPLKVELASIRINTTMVRYCRDWRKADALAYRALRAAANVNGRVRTKASAELLKRSSDLTEQTGRHRLAAKVKGAIAVLNAADAIDGADGRLEE